MGRVAATAVHLALGILGAALYVLFVLPRWWELMGYTSHTLGTVLRIVAGVLFALAALPVLLSLQRARNPERETPEPALRLRLASAVLHLVAGVLIVAAAVTEIWVSPDTAGPWLFGVYGAAAAMVLLGILAFQLAFIADQPPKPKKVRTPGKARKAKGEPDQTAERDETDEPEETDEADQTAAPDETDQTEADETEPDVPEPDEPEAVQTQVEPEPAEGGLRNKRPTGKTSHRLRRRHRGGVALDE